MMNRRAKAFLEILKDGRWHRKVVLKPVTLGTVEACVYLGLAQRRGMPSKEKGRFWASFQITSAGKTALRNNEYPTREKLSRAIHYTMCASLHGKHNFAQT